MDTYSRFIKKIQYASDGCWHWLGSIDKNGHGRFLVNGKNQLAHKYSYETHNNIISSGPVQHTCKTLHCVNPEHLTEENNGGRPIKITKQSVVAANQQGLTIKEIASKFNCSESLVRKKLK
jgi:hypothetical protein